MASTTTNNVALMRKNLLKATTQANESTRRNDYLKMVNGKKIGTTQLYEETALVSGLSLPTIVNEYGAVPTTEMTTPYTKTHTPRKRIIQFRISDEAFINDQYDKIKNYGPSLSHVFYVAKEIAGAVFMNGCLTSATISTPAGQPLASTAHPLETGTDSNRFATAQSLGVTALESAVQNMMSIKAYKGYTNPIAGPFKLEVAPSNAMLAKRIVNSNLQQGTADNDKNMVGDSITGIVVNPYFTNSGYWAIHSANEMENRRFLLDRYGFKITELKYDGDNDSWKVTAKESYLFDVMDWRDTYYSPAS